MKIQIRVILVRKMKSVVFIDAVWNAQTEQFMLDREVYDGVKFSIGDILTVEYQKGQNSKGQDVWLITGILEVREPLLRPAFSLNKIDNLKRRQFLRAVLGRDNLNIWRFRQIFIREIERYLWDSGLTRVDTNILMVNRGTSNAIPIRCMGNNIEQHYLKITHEVELKKIALATMNSVFDFSHVFRDTYETVIRTDEIMLLEGVLIENDTRVLSRIILDILEIARNVANETETPYLKDYDNVAVVDFDTVECAPGTTREETYQDYVNGITTPTLIYNAPINSPFVLKRNGRCVETIFHTQSKFKEMDGCDRVTSFYHGYEDENSYSAIRESFLSQQMKLKAQGIDADLPDDYLKMLQYGSPGTISFGFGLDRFIGVFLDCTSIQEIVHVIGM